MPINYMDKRIKEHKIMSLVKAEKYLQEKGFLDHVIELEASTATVAEAAAALGAEEGMIAKTMSFLQGEQPVLILTEGTAKVDNRKYKDTFHVKAKMIPFGEVEEKIGHAPGGVCPGADCRGKRLGRCLQGTIIWGENHLVSEQI